MESDPILDKITTLLDELETDQSRTEDPAILEELEEGRAFLLRFKEILELYEKM